MYQMLDSQEIANTQTKAFPSCSLLSTTFPCSFLFLTLVSSKNLFLFVYTIFLDGLFVYNSCRYLHSCFLIFAYATF